MWFAAAMAVGSMISANSARNDQMRAKAADAKLQRAKLERARTRATDDFVANKQRAREAAQKREVQMESNRINAESKVDTTFAGSGISGQSLDELDAELNASVVKNKIENKKALEQELGSLQRGFSHTMDDSAAQAQAIDTTAVEGSFLGDAATGMSAYAGASNFGSSLASSGAKGARVSRFLGFGN